MAELGKLPFHNKVMDRTAMKRSISSLMTHSGTVYTAHIPDQPKTLGFQQATHAAVSPGIDDPLTTPSREWLVRDAEPRGFFEEEHHRYGNVHAVERSRLLIEAWYTTGEYTKTEMSPNPRTTDPSNPVHVMPLPGARGNISQIHQSLGMRGSMPDPKGQILDLPIRSNSREGPSLTEYITPRYGARKGIADIAVRTADAGYLTRRPVEVVQRIVARKMDRGTIRGITVSPIRDQQNGQMIAQSRPIGRVSAGNAYVDVRRIATRDQDTGAEPANQSIAFQTRPISIRSPSVCKSMFWIRRSRYGWSLTHGGLIGLGEAVGIIAGQSIGEPGTQLTPRTSHTGGIPTGDIAQHIRTPSTGTIKSNADSVHLTRTRHGHPAWVCDDDSSVVTGNEYEARDPTTPSQSSIPVQNNQHVESKQVVAEVHVATSTPKERVHKYIHSNLYGELHSAKARHNSSGHIYSNIHLPPETSYVWVSSGGPCDPGGTRPVSYDGGDKIDAQSLSAGKDQSLPDLYPNDQMNPNPFSDRSDGEPTFNHSRRCDHRVPNHHRYENLIYLSPPHGYKVMTRGHEKGGVFPPSGRHEHRRCDRKIPRSEPVPEIQRNKVSRIAESSAVSNDSGYVTKEPEFVEYSTKKVDSAGGRNSMENGGTERLVARQMIGEGNFRPIPEGEIRIVHKSPSSLLSRANTVRAGTQITPSIYGRLSGLVGVRGTGNGSIIRILPGNIIRVKESRGVSERRDTSMPPREILPGTSESSTDWNHYRCIAPYTGKPLASLLLLRPAMEYNEIRSESSISTKAFPNWNLPREGRRGAPSGVRAVKYPLREDGVGIIGDTGIRSVQPRRPVSDRREEKDLIEEAYTPSIEVGTNTPPVQYYPNLHRDSMRHTLVDSGGGGGCDTAASFQYISNAGAHCTSSSPDDDNPVFGQHKGILRISPNRYRERTSFPVSSPNDVSHTPLSTPGHTVGDGRKPDGDNAISAPANPPNDSRALPPRRRGNERSTQLDPIITTDAPLASPRDDFARITPLETLGIPGNSHGMVHPALPPHRSTSHRSTSEVLLNEYSIIDNLKKTSRVPEWYLWDEDRTNSHFVTRERTQTPTYLHPLNLTRRLPSSLCTTFRSVSLGQSICGGVSVCGSGLPSQSCQIKAVDIEFTVIRLAEPYSADGGATANSSSGGIVGKGDAPITPIHERSRSEDTIPQGPPKIEQFSESRPNTSASMDSKDSFGDRNSGMAWISGCPPGYPLSARISLERSQTNSVDRTGRGYRSQGVQIADKHAEIIARQITSKMITLEDGMANAFPPGEPTEISRARRMNRAPEAKITYRPVSSGTTRASPNTKSLIPEASFRETTRVLARAAIRGQMDRLKGLKENVIVGGVAPAGTGCEGVLRQVTPLDGPEEISETEEKLFHLMVEDLFFSHGKTEFRLPPSKKTIHEVSASSVVSGVDFEKQL
uniref:DNA-directed RNA polymerase n=1 Tax=Selaginella nummulariifolia TaxID=1715387 RepID=A0A650FGS8_9TRAC|nr:RNA polymerase beta'' subunit [Selaginella nummulariifolia]